MITLKMIFYIGKWLQEFLNIILFKGLNNHFIPWVAIVSGDMLMRYFYAHCTYCVVVLHRHAICHECTDIIHVIYFLEGLVFVLNIRFLLKILFLSNFTVF